MRGKGEKGEEGEEQYKQAARTHLVLPDPALAPDEDGLHLRRHHLHAGSGGARDAQLEGDAGVRRHAATLRVPATNAIDRGLECEQMHGPNCLAEISEKMGRRLREPVLCTGR